MLGQRIGYIRVSSLDQHEERQLEGIELAKTFIDKASGGKLGEICTNVEVKLTKSARIVEIDHPNLEKPLPI